MGAAGLSCKRYDLALDANVNGPYQVMMFAKKCNKLKLLIHFSTGNRILQLFSMEKWEFPGVLADPNCVIDVVPVDMVVNATMVAIAKHGYSQSPELNVYHVASSSSINPLLVSQLFDYCNEFFHSFPFVNSKGDQVKLKKMRYFDNISDFSNYISEQLIEQHDEVQELIEVEQSSKMQMRFKRKVEYQENFMLYETI
ncbi:hypothetical protein HAX54_020839 [Datura stramonium]|uniref:Fatty acyl-CoA reductase n=1 Tax=Datura stramonium TaxID=4076 RepID=A0ABS8S2W2_DATST|nr:hypothetical protein [Datura stramonium]MCD7453423.1 hypothetical protein [Datura stramonium]